MDWEGKETNYLCDCKWVGEYPKLVSLCPHHMAFVQREYAVNSLLLQLPLLKDQG